MRNINLLVCSLLLVSGSAFAQSESEKSGEAQYQDDSAYGTERTIEKKGDKTIIRERGGKLNERKGGPKVGQINEGETTKIEKRIKSLRLTSLGLGPYGSAQVDGHPMNYGFSYYKHFEAGVHGEILVGTTMAFSGHSSFGIFGVGGNYFFSDEELSPLVGGEFGYGFARYDKTASESKSEAGFAGRIEGGLRIFRTSDAQLEFLASYTTVFSSSTPGFYGLEVRILY